MGGGANPFAKRFYSADDFELSLDPEKAQAFGAFLGYDVLIDNPNNSDSSEAKNKTRQHRLFAGIYSDNIVKKGKKNYYSDLGLYYAYQFTPGFKLGKLIEVSIIDLYFNLLAQKYNIEWKNELIYRTGKTSGDLAEGLGGAEDSGGKLDSLAFTSNLQWTFYQSGSFDGPLDLRTGDLIKHKLFLDFVYLPGAKLDTVTDRALAFNANRNFSRSLILFNGSSRFYR